MNKKRKTSTLVEEESEDDLVGDLLDDAFSQSEDDEAAELSADERSAGEDETEDGDEDDEADEEAEDEDEDALSDDETPDNQIHNELKANGELNGHRKGAEYSVVTDANGGERYVYREIDPVYDSDDTDAQEPVNTIGDIPLSFYDAYPHIGYDIHGKKVMRPASKDALDALLDKMEVPEGWTGLLDKETGDGLKISREELELIRRVQGSLIPEEGYNPYEEALEWFTNVEEKMPLSSAPEPKRRFLPSKHEAKRIMKMVRAIREGRLLPYKPPEEREEEVEEDEVYDIWANEEPREESIMHIPAPKLPPPGYDQSYNPPPEYLPTKQEKEAWEKLEPEEREKDYLPASYPSLRQVPGWDLFTKSRFERCLDLYLAPRVRKNRLNIDPNSLLPKMPKPEELRPFPTVCQTVFRGHEGYIRSVDIDPTGNFLASGGDDGVIRVWDILTGRCVWSVRLQTEDPIDCVRWRPSKDAFILSAVSGEEVFLIIPPMLVDFELEEASRKILDAGFGYKAQSAAATKEPAAKWERPGAKLEDEGVLLRLTVRSAIKAISWHRRGDHFCTTSPRGQRSSIIVHTLSKHLSQIPFRKLSGLAQAAHFHPSRPLFFVATQRMIRVYDLQKLELIKVLQPGAKLISSFDIHQGGDNVVVGSYDKRLLWMDLDLSVRPYKTMRFHDEAVRSVKYHKGGLPLFADCSDDGTIQIFHGKVANDLMANPTIIPVKALRGHSVVKRLGVMDICWHPQQPWLVSAGADGTCRLWM